jgi:amidase
MINYNEKNNIYTDQGFWRKGLNSSVDHVALASAIRECRRLGGTDGLDRVFQKYEIDIVIAPGDSGLCIHAAHAGYPIAVAPMDVLKYNGRPFGICMVARAHREDHLMKFLRIWEKSVGNRPLPLPLMEAERNMWRGS